MKIIDDIRSRRDITREELEMLLATDDKALVECLRSAAREVADAIYGKEVDIRGLIELSSYCRNDCLYCGLRRSNAACRRYRLSQDEILACADEGHALGFRTFVLQGGEDPFFDDARLCAIVRALKAAHPDCAVTLSVGERSAARYRASANRSISKIFI